MTLTATITDPSGTAFTGVTDPTPSVTVTVECLATSLSFTNDGTGDATYNIEDATATGITIS